MFFRITALFCFITAFFNLSAQDAGVKGSVKDIKSGAEIENVQIQIEGSTLSTTTNQDGYYIISEIPPGNYKLIASISGYSSDTVNITITAGKYSLVNIFLKLIVYELAGAKVSDSKKRKKKEDIEIGTSRIKATQLSKIPTIGGTPDLIQYLQILPGVVFSGDQGGQLSIRGGSPVMTKIILDGMTIYNPFL